jgi:hypothetical protein
MLLAALMALPGCSSQPLIQTAATPAQVPTFSASDELFERGSARVNYWRALAKLPEVKVGPSVPAAGHARYLIENHISSPDRVFAEDPANPWYQPQFASAPWNRLILLTDRIPEDAQTMVDTWFTDPYTAFNILGIEGNRVGYGDYCAAGRCALVLQILYDASAQLASSPVQAVFPLRFPPPGAIIPPAMIAYRGAASTPPLPLAPASTSVRFLANCPGYELPTGPPIILELGPRLLSDHVLTITDTSLKRDERPIEHCVVDWNSYGNSQGGLAWLVRNLMSVYQTAVLIPRQPLHLGASYTVSITVEGKQYRWTFSTEQSPHRRAARMPEAPAYIGGRVPESTALMEEGRS